MFKSNNFLTIFAIISLVFLSAVLIIAVIQYTQPVKEEVVSIIKPVSTPVSAPISNPV